MTDEADGVARKLAELKSAFDRMFAEPPAGRPPKLRDYLALRVAGQRFAVAISEIAGLEPVRKIVPLPVDRPNLLGLTGVRGRMVPVYSFAGLMGLSEPDEGARWLAVCRHTAAVALAFERVEEYLRPEQADVFASASAGQGHVKATLRTPGGGLPVVSLGSVLAALEAGA